MPASGEIAAMLSFLRTVLRPSAPGLPIGIAVLAWIAIWAFYFFQGSELDRNAQDEAQRRSGEISSFYAAETSTTLDLVANVLTFVGTQAAETGIEAAVSLVSQ